MPELRAARRHFLLGLPRDQVVGLLEQMDETQRRSLERYWALWAHPAQIPPSRPWHTWLIMAGRGFGKTRAGAEWVRSVVERDPTARVALVAASLGEARAVMVEGESGLLAVAREGERPRYEPSRRLLTWENGARAMLYSAGEPESLRGPQHSHARRSGAEGGDGQRGADARRPPAPPNHRGRGGNTPRDAYCRRDVADCECAY